MNTISNPARWMRFGKTRSRVFSVLLALGVSFPGLAQFSWNDLAGWDGQTHWTRYLMYSPAYFGPNALPVPEMNEGRVDRISSFETALAGHFMPGERSLNPLIRYTGVLLPGRASMSFSMVPVEYYHLSANLRDERLCRDQNPEGLAVGDLNFTTRFNLLPDSLDQGLCFEMSGRTTSGGGLKNARFTDAPGYHFSLTYAHQHLMPRLDNVLIRWYGSLGFYCWQTNLDDYLQNDAILYGLGAGVERGSWLIRQQLTGYFGYISLKKEVVVKSSSKPRIYDGDQPLVYRLEVIKPLSRGDRGFYLQKGLHDFNYQTVMIRYVRFVSSR